MEKIIEAIDISKIYGSHYVAKNVTQNPMADVFQAKIAEVVNKVPTTVALDHVDLTIYRGDFVCIMGPSGSGKTTLLNAISTIDPPTKGKVLIEGKNIKKMGDIEIGNFRHKYLGFIFQKFNLLENLTVFENIAMPLTIAKTSDKEIETRIFDISEKVGIKDILDKYPTECSGGQCQRVAIARALITNPKLIVADEPTGNLDSKNSHEILQLLKKLNKEDGVTILMVTHDSMIASYAKRLLFIMDGKIAKVLDRNDMKQKEFYHQIMDITSHDAMELLEDEE